ncbi:MAG: 16S rRNA (cytosine(1402)-N(4))-methyltransferase RsmH [candidate division Zixibacteria bacterium]|nr:16S rRNA (cytosine(1402)-N(4))-methyltransferase RsmH [candidate division Zixibacteria bacterium]
MADEVLRELITDLDGIYFDATIGNAGHAELIMNRLSPNAKLVGSDSDPEAAALAVRRLAAFGERAIVVHADYRELAKIFEDLGIEKINGALFDLGLSSLQLDNPRRGFAYRLDGPLDLRFDPTRGQPTSDWVNSASEEELAGIFKRFGEEPNARRIARRIVKLRAAQPIETTTQLRDLIISVVGPNGRIWGRTAARIFQALRVHSNSELDAIAMGLTSALDLLSEGSRLVVIAYHSLEDRIVKTIMREAARKCDCPRIYGQCRCGASPRGHLVHKRVLRPTEAECAANPRAQAARMRVFEVHISESSWGTK